MTTMMLTIKMLMMVLDSDNNGCGDGDFDAVFEC